MSSGLRQFAILTRLAFVELVRQPVAFLLALSCMVLSIVLPLLSAHQLGQQAGLARDGALAFELVGGAVLTAYAACSTLSSELRRGTILTLLSRPLPREILFLAKFSAVAALLAGFVGCSACAALLAERMTPRFFETDTFGLRVLTAVPFVALLPAAWLNWRKGWSFPACGWALLGLALAAAVVALSRVDPEGHQGHPGQFVDLRLVPAAVLVGIGLLILAALALGLAAHLPLAPTAAILLAVLFAGLMSDYLAQQFSTCAPAAGAVRLVLPDLQRFWPADDLSGEAPFGWRSLGGAAGYGALYTAGLLCLGMAAFRRRQF